MRFLVCLLLVFTVGCTSGLFNKRSEKQAMDSAEKLNSQSQANLERVIEGQKEQPRPNISPQIDIKGSSNQVDIKIQAPLPPEPVQPYREFTGYGTRTNQKVTTSQSWWSDYKNTLPLGISMLAIAIGGYAIIVLLRKARQSSAAFNSMAGMVDGQMAHWLDELNDQMAKEKDSDAQARMAVDRAAMEKFRGKLAEMKPKK
jgi:hypothetical protein